MAETKLLIGVTGRIGSGKTEVAQCLRDRFGFKYFRYSLVLAEWYDADPAAKGRLQEVGWQVMSTDRQLELNRRLIAPIDPNLDCAVDGLRHIIDFSSLEAEFSSRFHLLFVETPVEDRFERLRDRYSTYSDFLAADSHPVECHVDSLKPLAAVVLPGTLPLEQLETRLHSILRKFRSA